MFGPELGIVGNTPPGGENHAVVALVVGEVIVFVKVGIPELQLIVPDKAFKVLVGMVVLIPIAKVCDTAQLVAGSVIVTV